MGKILIITILLFSSAFQVNAKPLPATVSSPDKKLKVSFVSVKGQGVTYQVSYLGATVLQNSKLGIIRSDADFTKSLTILHVSPVQAVIDNYTMLFAKKSKISYKANKIILHCINGLKMPMDILFQVSNDGVAFRYYFPDKKTPVKEVLSEVTSYQFPVETRAWLQPMQVAKTGWQQTNPAYEEYYKQDISVNTPPPTEAGWVYPALFKQHNTWVLITEAALDSNYCATRLIPGAANGEYQVGFPSVKEVFTGKGNLPEFKPPFYTPWRVIAIGSLKTLMESTLGTDVASPQKIKNVFYAIPGKSSWSWINSKDDSIVYSEQKRYVDFAANMHWKYCLIDADWDRKIGYEKVAELAAYAKTKNVGLLLWYNSAGDWNTVKYTPKNILLTADKRRREFQRLAQMGIKGVKIDFFGGDGSSMIQYYINILQDAADYHLMVNFHGTTLPRGLERTYPNLMTAEAVRGFENITFRQADADQEATHCAMLPFTRNIFDPMDFTPMNLYQIPTKVIRKTSSGFELALSVLFLSGIQHFAESPEGMKHVPEYVQNFLRNLPDKWDDVKFIDGYPGKYLVIARRTGSKWYVAGINGENKEKAISIDLSLFHIKNLMLITDDMEPLSFKQQTWPVERQMKLTLKPNGGFVAVSK
ncbi:MAG: glycoside hydrolase family 97 catalytic domain-containing protein [Janthinobacterium lividum]